ncbi:hypothetical protein V8G54_029583 [Vigna mungo]|uniref:Transposase MuDR plant domain-containing protein n=1 Tax=Vigna mungo TaxID=3915 RepID=A0AAQ3MUJ2_VIGMU
MNMMKVANLLEKVDLYVVHGVNHAKVVEDDVNQIYFLCEVEAPASSGEGSGVEGFPHVEHGDEGNMDEIEVQKEVEEGAIENGEVRVQLVTEGELVSQGELMGTNGRFKVDMDIEGGVEVEINGREEVDGGVEVEQTVGKEVNGELEVDKDGGVEVDDGLEVDKDDGVREEAVVESEDGVDSEEEVEVKNEDERHMDHLSADEYVVEAEEVGIGLEDKDEEYRAKASGRGFGSEDDTEDRPKHSPFPTYENQKSMANYKWEVGTLFTNKDKFKEAIRSYAMHTMRALKFVKNDKRRVRVRCIGGQGKCPWVAYCRYFPTRQFWQLRKINDTHSCSRKLNIKIMNTKWLSHEIDRSLQDNRDLKVQDIRNKTLWKWNTKVSISKARRAKLMAAKKLSGDFKEQLRRIYDYVHELLRCNPGSTIKVRLIVVMVRQAVKGELLTAIGRDPNEQMLPLAYAVVELLIKDLGGNEVCDECTWMFDQQKGRPKILHKALLRKFYKEVFWSDFENSDVRKTHYHNAGGDMTLSNETLGHQQKQGHIYGFHYLPKDKEQAYEEIKFEGHRLKKEEEKGRKEESMDRLASNSNVERLIRGGATVWHPGDDAERPERLEANRSAVNLGARAVARLEGKPLNGQLRRLGGERYWVYQLYYLITIWYTCQGLNTATNYSKYAWEVKEKKKVKAWELTKDATQMRVGGHRKKCTICRQLGHNKKNCPLRPDITQPTCPLASQQTFKLEEAKKENEILKAMLTSFMILLYRLYYRTLPSSGVTDSTMCCHRHCALSSALCVVVVIDVKLVGKCLSKKKWEMSRVGHRVPLTALVPRSNRGFGSTAAAQCYYEDDKEEECAGCKPKRGVQWVVIGEPGARRNLLAQRLSKLLEVPHISMATLLSQDLNPRSHLYHQIANALDHGKLVLKENILL